MQDPREFNGALAANGNVFELGVRGLTTLAIQIVGAMSATLQFEATINGKDYFSLNVVPVNSSSPVTSTTAAGVWFANISGLLSVRIRCSAWTSGTPTIMMRAIEDGVAVPAGVNGSGMVVSSTRKRAKIVASASGVTILVAAVVGKKIIITDLILTSSGSVNVKFQSHTAGDITGLYYLASNGGAVLPNNDNGWMETVAGESFDINLSSAVPVGGHFDYVEFS